MTPAPTTTKPSWLASRLLPSGISSNPIRAAMAILLLALAGLMILAGATKLTLAAEGPTQPPAHWQWQAEWGWPPAKWEWPPVGGWYQDDKGQFVDRESGRVWGAAPFVVMPDGRVLDRQTLQPPPQSGVDRVALINVVHHSLRSWIPLSPLGLLIVVAGIELAAGALLIFSRRRKPIIAVGVAAMVAIFSVIMLLARPELAGQDCGCFGGLLDSENLWINLARNAALVAVALVLAVVWSKRRVP